MHCISVSMSVPMSVPMQTPPPKQPKFPDPCVSSSQYYAGGAGRQAAQSKMLEMGT
jgi:hypothetical protein